MRWIVAIGLALSAAAASAQVPVEQLAKPPAHAKRYVIMSTAGKHGEASEWTAADGARMGRASLVLRGQVWEVDEASRYGPDGMLSRYELRGVSPQGDVGETFTVAGGKATWKSPIDGGSAAYAAPAFYLAAGPTVGNFNDVLERLIAAPDHSLALLPGGKARLEPLTTATVGSGANRKKVIAYALTGISNSPIPIWATEDGKFFASIGGLSTIPVGYEDAQPILEKAQDDALAARSPALARRARPDRLRAGGLHQRPRLPRRQPLRRGQTVVVDKGRIIAFGPAAERPGPGRRAGHRRHAARPSSPACGTRTCMSATTRRADAALDRRDLGARSGQRRPPDHRAARAAREGRAALPDGLCLGPDRRQRARTAQVPRSRPRRRKRSRRSGWRRRTA